MTIVGYLQDLIAYLKKLIAEARIEIFDTYSKFDNAYAPRPFIRSHKRQLGLGFLTLLLIFYFPLFSVWLLASFVPLYHGAKILKTIIQENKIKKQTAEMESHMSFFLKQAAKTGNPLTLPLKLNNQYVERIGFVVSNNEDGISLRDPETKMIITYPWYKINFEILYEREVAPNLSQIENFTERDVFPKLTDWIKTKTQ